MSRLHRKRILAAFCLLIMTALIACSAVYTPTPLPVPVSPTAIVPFPLKTATPVKPQPLPPTWTPTFTFTPPPPTYTPSPTLTPTVAPTLTTDEICAGFEVQLGVENGYAFAPDSGFGLNLSTTTTAVQMRFLMTHRLSGENKGLMIPGGQAALIQFPVQQLPRPGLYDWTASVYTESGEEICQQYGYFFVNRPEHDTTPEATPASAQ